jgi:hypothetical protein
MSAYARRVLVRLGHLFLALALLGATGGHWAVLQTVAWTTMLADNLQTESVTTAITKTFDGKSPCRMCNQITEGKKAEKQSELPFQIKKLEFITERPALVLAAPTRFTLTREHSDSLNGQRNRPPVPPPRGRAV